MKIAIIAVIAALTLAACGGTNQNGTAVSEANVPFVSTFYVDTIDGQKVVCIWAGLGYGGGLSCDWSR
jgi:hypothetical protein